MANNNKKRGGGYLSGPAKRGGSLLSGGKSIFLIFILVVIAGGVLLSGGNPFPQNQLTEPDEDVIYEVDPESLQQNGDGRQNIQLKTIGFKECGGITAVTMQLDITGSMRSALPNLKNAVYTFTDQMSDDSVIGIQAYSDRDDSTDNDARVEVIPVSYYRDVKDQIRPAVNALTADGNTPTYDALQYSREVLQNAMPQYPDRQFNFIFMSDGDPNEGPSTPDDIANAAQEIKDLGVTVYSIGLGNVNPNIITRVASSPDKAYTTASSSNLSQIYTQISQRICRSAEEENN